MTDLNEIAEMVRAKERVRGRWHTDREFRDQLVSIVPCAAPYCNKDCMYMDIPLCAAHRDAVKDPPCSK
jgi:hypothetical protein